MFLVNKVGILVDRHEEFPHLMSLKKVNLNIFDDAASGVVT